LRAGAKQVEIDLSFREKEHIFFAESSDEQLQAISPLYETALLEFDGYLYIRAPFNLREDARRDARKSGIRGEILSRISEIYAQRTATRQLKRTLCQYPTDAAAQEAGMSLSEYEQFVFNACKLFEPDPQAAWLQVRHEQQRIVDFLNTSKSVVYKHPDFEISFLTDGRTWINSDGQTNMPSGEVYTSPREDSVEGKIYFSYPGLYGGQEVEGVTLWVKNGYIERWEARRGQEYLDTIFTREGTRRFGEAAIGTNYGIQQLTRNILFDEKIGGTVHMAIGQSYLQAGGKNQSSVHWDMITDMTKGGQIFADGTEIYRNGLFLI
jgi:aminopeptidase